MSFDRPEKWSRELEEKLTIRSSFLIFRTAAFLIAGLESLAGSTMASRVVARAKTRGDQWTVSTISGERAPMRAEM